MVDAVDNNRSISRRTVATGLAWSVPAVVAASTLPAFAASTPTLEVSGGTKKASGNNWVSLSLDSFTAVVTPATGTVSNLVMTFTLPASGLTISRYDTAAWVLSSSGTQYSFTYRGQYTTSGNMQITVTPLSFTTSQYKSKDYGTDASVSATAVVDGTSVKATAQSL
ncbi:hypothetical protein [Acidipropionibacterium timonense]|uniref:hypothetical protein n=1 Tax=Acidipropionibacterium timonense TaxID=2161818 RepID=UPI00102F70AE|nr:hypothetical protein [Acidipropionibacterium timonense]